MATPRIPWSEQLANKNLVQREGRCIRGSRGDVNTLAWQGDRDDLTLVPVPPKTSHVGGREMLKMPISFSFCRVAELTCGEGRGGKEKTHEGFCLLGYICIYSVFVWTEFTRPYKDGWGRRALPGRSRDRLGLKPTAAGGEARSRGLELNTFRRAGFK